MSHTRPRPRRWTAQLPTLKATPALGWILGEPSVRATHPSSGSHTGLGRDTQHHRPGNRNRTHSVPCRGRPGALLRFPTRKNGASPTQRFQSCQLLPLPTQPFRGSPAHLAQGARPGRTPTPRQHGLRNFLGQGPGVGVWPAPGLLQSPEVPRHRLPRTHVLPMTSSPHSGPVTARHTEPHPLNENLQRQQAGRRPPRRGRRTRGDR